MFKHLIFFLFLSPFFPPFLKKIFWQHPLFPEVMWAAIVHWSSFFQKGKRQQRENNHHPLETCDSSGPACVRCRTFKVQEENKWRSPGFHCCNCSQGQRRLRRLASLGYVPSDGWCHWHRSRGAMVVTTSTLHATSRKKRIYTTSLRNLESQAANQCWAKQLSHAADGKRENLP